MGRRSPPKLGNDDGKTFDPERMMEETVSVTDWAQASMARRRVRGRERSLLKDMLGSKTLA